ncbi:hypothetical protein DFH09DRAFT_1425250, partial [Mycena vulgaris]
IFPHGSVKTPQSLYYIPRHIFASFLQFSKNSPNPSAVFGRAWLELRAPFHLAFLLSATRPNPDLEMSTGSLYFCGILGSNDDWMAADMAVAAAILDGPATFMHFFTTVPFREFGCCSDDGGYFKVGDHAPGADRLEVPVPDEALVVLNSNGAILKDIFLQKIASISTRMEPADRLVVFIAAHARGEEDDGEVLIGGQALKISEVAGVVHDDATTVLWSRGKWVEGEGEGPRHGHVGAASKEDSDSLDSNYNRGGASMLATFAALAADQNAVVPSDSDKSSNSFDQPTPIGETPRPLPVPQLPSDVLNRFRLVSQPPAAPPTTTKSASFRVALQQLPPLPGLDLHELAEGGTQLLDAQVGQAGLVFLQRRLQRATFSEADARVLAGAFAHRRTCRAAIAAYVGWAGWGAARRPRWDFSGGGAALEREMVGAAAEEGEEAAAAWREFFCWRPQGEGWRNLTWTDIRQQLALAWEGAGRPRFAAVDFLAVAERVDEFRKEGVLMKGSTSVRTVVLARAGSRL